MDMDTNDTMDKMSEAGKSMNRMADTAKQTVSDVSNKLMERSRMAASTTDQYVRQYAWSSVALAALLGVVVGLMIKRS